MSTVDKAKLRELAEKAGSGHWYEDGELRYHDDRSGETHGLHHDEDGFIAAANPAAVLALLDEIESLRKDKARLDSRCIVTNERDEFGEEYHCERRGLDLRAAIDMAMMLEELDRGR